MNADLQQDDGIARRPKPLWRQLVLCFALLAFTLQTYAGLTHFHHIPVQHQTQLSLPSEGSAGHDPADCPICTHIHLAGHFLLPGDVAAAAPLLAVQIVPVALAPVILHDTASHIWRGRGPPRI